MTHDHEAWDDDDALAGRLGSELRRAALHVPAYQGSAAAVQRRGTWLRRRRYAAAVPVMAMAVLAVAVVPQLAGPSAPRGSTLLATAADVERSRAGGGRLLLGRVPIVVASSPATEPVVRLPHPTGVVEVRNGVFQEVVRVSKDETVWGNSALADGGTVALIARDEQPGQPRTDGPWAEGISRVLRAVDADGAVTAEHPVGRRGDYAVLLGAHQRQAVVSLTRATAAPPYAPAAMSRLVAVDLDTGVERPLATTAHPGGGDVFGDVAVLATRAVGEHASCRLHAVPLAGGDVVDVASLPCDGGVAGVRVAPSGDVAAVVLEAAEPGRPLRVVVVDVSSGRVFHENDGPPESTPAGVAWVDDQTLQLAVVTTRALRHPVPPLEQLVRVETLRIR